MRTVILTEAEQQAVAEAVAEAEKCTGGDIATAIIPESDDYGFWELLAAVVFSAIVFSACASFAGTLESALTARLWVVEAWMVPVVCGVAAIVAGGLFYLVAQVPVIDRFVVPRRVMKDAVRKRSRRHFMESGVYDTRDRTGILIFISLLERRVELIADRGISSVVPHQRWEAIVAELTRGIAAGRSGTSLVTAVESIGAILAEHVTRRDDDENELSDRPDTLEPGS